LLESGYTALKKVTQVLCVEIYLFIQEFFRLLEYKNKLHLLDFSKKKKQVPF